MDSEQHQIFHNMLHSSKTGMKLLATFVGNSAAIREKEKKMRNMQ